MGNLDASQQFAAAEVGRSCEALLPPLDNLLIKTAF